MNRLVIVGNGFDLSHGLKTRYEDFLLWVFKDALDKAYKNTNNYYRDSSLIEVEYNTDVNQHESIESLEGLMSNPNFYIPLSEINGRVKQRAPIFIKFKSNFLKKLLKDGKWTDIESAYFTHLTTLALSNSSLREDHTKAFHQEFDELTNLLKIYMTNIEYELGSIKKYPKIYNIDKCFDEVSDDNFKHYFKGYAPAMKPLSTVMFLNFNYTSLLGRYLNKSLAASNHISVKDKYCKLVHIHGRIKVNEEIIFGYGDDTHPQYRELELLHDDEVLSKMKSFKYPTNPWYNKGLVDFIETRVFDVIVMGHSLGISDRVLLKTIFENENCRMITVLHREDNQNDFRKWIPLSRHFDDKVDMRNKIKSFEEGDVM